MKIIRGLILVLAGALAVATPAHAAPITLIGGTAGSIPANAINDFLPLFSAGPLIGGYFGTQVSVDAPLPSIILFEFFGADAFFHNEFNVVGSELFDHTGSPIPDIAPSLAAPFASFQKTAVGSGLLPFSFDIDSDASSVANGGNPDFAGGPVGPNFFATCDPFSGAAGSGGTTCGRLYLFLDDAGGPDPDYDDFLVRVTVTPDVDLTPELFLAPVPVPEPATLSLLGLGLLGWAGRRVRARRNGESGSGTP
jgi:PEP-CTERM motif-containing protein